MRSSAAQLAARVTSHLTACSLSGGATGLAALPCLSHAALRQSGSLQGALGAASEAVAAAGPRSASTAAGEGQAQQLGAASKELVLAIRARVFGEPIRSGERTGRRALSLRGAELASWYWIPPRETPGFHNEERE